MEHKRDRLPRRSHHPALHHTMGSLEIDTEFKVVNASPKFIPGLIAAGEVGGDLHSFIHLGGSRYCESSFCMISDPMLIQWSYNSCLAFGHVAGDSVAAYLFPECPIYFGQGFFSFRCRRWTYPARRNKGGCRPTWRAGEHRLLVERPKLFVVFVECACIPIHPAPK